VTPIVRFYFSFRSPYAWFAAERWSVEIGAAGNADHIPFYPTPETFPNDPTRFPAKFAYVIQDVRRLAKHFGLPLGRLHSLDTDWARAHAAYLGVRAEAPEGAERFLLEMFRARFSRGLDVAADRVIEEAAERAEVSAAVATRGAASRELQAEVSGNFRLGQERDGIFGAPSFAYDGQLFWGHDRLPHLRAALVEARANPSAA
jgi:2-hydroxychromene-2-carboxylate isomerase